MSKRKVPRLMGAAEAAETLGVRQQNLRIVAGLPEPVTKVRATTLWWADEIEAFAREREERRKPEEPVAA